MRHVYLHGFASSAASRKGVELARRFAERGVELELRDLNVPSFEELTYTSALGSLDDLLEDEGPVRIVGSSLGGYLAARWAELHPERVERLVLFCPGFDLPSRWPSLIGHEALRHWERTGSLEAPDFEGRVRRLHWGFMEDARRHPAYPEVPCETLILHGTRDEVVPIESSRDYAATRPHVRLVELDDDHSLVDSLDRLFAEIGRYLFDWKSSR